MKKVLFIEDNVMAQALIADVFGDQEIITIVGDYASAMVALDHGQYDLVITDIFFPQETGSGKREMVSNLAERLRDLVKSYGDLPYNVERARRTRRRNFDREFKLRCLKLCTESIRRSIEIDAGTIEGIKSWEISSLENQQPLGVYIAEECVKRKISFRITTNLYHHSKMVQAICSLVRVRGWPEIFDGDNGEISKESRIFWEKLREVIEK